MQPVWNSKEKKLACKTNCIKNIPKSEESNYSLEFTSTAVPLIFLSPNFFRDETFMLSVQFSFSLWEDILLAYFTLWKQSIILPCDQSKMKRKYKMISFTASRFKMKKLDRKKKKTFLRSKIVLSMHEFIWSWDSNLPKYLVVLIKYRKIN